MPLIAVTKEQSGVGWNKNYYKFVGAYSTQCHPAYVIYYMLNRWYEPSIDRFIIKDLLLYPKILQIVII
jgi:hypothetical protein